MYQLLGFFTRVGIMASVLLKKNKPTQSGAVQEVYYSLFPLWFP